ncbi:HNH endonuclease [Ornithinimicrobium sp. F0845]|uniref:HNH endonuclease signature motif containing protein n=1 Tax=Ornithinimicrobium sp. F0845 TaxID=2926412 RepID=UPI001FF6D64C|nr:HNH endonuclease [Ornithinimicrobium sp. F0845]
MRTEEGDLDSPEFWALVAEVDAATSPGTPGATEASGWVDPVQELAGGLATAARGLDRAALGEQGLVGVFDAGIEEGLEAAGRVRDQLTGVTMGLALEAFSRGLHSAVGLTLVSWLRQRCPWLSKAEAAQVQDVARAGETFWGKDLAAVVVAGRTGVHRAALVARTMRRLVGCLSAEDAVAFTEIATAAACNTGLSDAELEVVCKKLLIDLLDKKPRDEAKRTAQQLRCVRRRRLGTGMTRYTVDAPESDVPLFDGVLTGPLAAPAPQEDGGLDLRGAGQRGYDALLMVLNRGLSNPGAPPSSGRASVMITIKADPDTGQPGGPGVSHTGTVLDAEQTGRYACIGDLTPVALGQYGEPLALGRTVRLATPGQFKALMVRDGQCTYPGCDVPGTWCDSHHLVWWCRGGTTDLAVLVLLCPRHHTLVHDQDLMATVTGSIVTWHV